MRRNNLEVSVAILKAANGGSTKTRIVSKSNLNFEIIKEYLNTLTRGGLLTVDEKGRYSTTDKGLKFIEDYYNLTEPLNHKTQTQPPTQP